MFQPIIERRYLFEVNLTTISNGQIYNLTVAPQILLDAQVYGLMMYTNGSVGFSPNNAPVVTNGGAANILVTFQELQTSNQFVNQAAYTDFCPTFNNGAVRIFKPRKVNWSKSYIQVINTTGLTAGQSVIIDVIYKY